MSGGDVGEHQSDHHYPVHIISAAWLPAFEHSDGHLVCIIHSSSVFRCLILSNRAERRARGSGLIYYRWAIVY